MHAFFICLQWCKVQTPPKKQEAEHDDWEEVAIYCVCGLAVILFAYILWVVFVPWFNDMIVPDVKASYDQKLMFGSVFGLLAYAAFRKNKNK